jgi:hypothetical protein
MVCCTLFFECIDTLSLKVWQKMSYSSCTAIYLNMCISHSVTQCCLPVLFASWIIVRFMAVLWLELFDFNNSKYSVCIMCIVFIFSSNCSCVYSFTVLAFRAISFWIQYQHSHYIMKCWSLPSADRLWKVAYQLRGSWGLFLLVPWNQDLHYRCYVFNICHMSGNVKYFI